MYPLKQSSTAQPLVFLMVDSTDHVTGKTGLSPTVTIRKVGGSFAAPSGAVTEIANGFYQVAGNATDTGTLGPLLLHATGTAADPTDVVYHVVAYDPQDAVRAGLTALPNAAAGANGGLPLGDASARVDVAKIAGTTQTARDLGASVLLSAGTGTGQLDFTAGVVKANLAQILGTALTETAGQIAAAFRQFFNIASPTSTMNTITAVTTATNLTTNNDKTGYSLSAGGVTAVQSGLATSAALTTAQADLDDIQTRLPAALVSGRMDSNVGAMAAGVVTAAAVATNAIDADALAADAVTEIAAGVSVGSAPTAAQNAAAVRTELTTELARLDVAVSTRAASGAGGTVGSGSRSYPIRVLRPDGVTPIEGVAVWVTTDTAGTNVVAGTIYTDTLGRINTTVGFMLDPGTYQLWQQHGSFNFANPTQFTVT